MNKGMVTATTSMTNPDGSFLDLQGFDVTVRGLKRHGGWSPAIYDPTSGNPLAIPYEFEGERLEDILQMWLEDGSIVNLALTNRCLYTMDKSLGYATVYWGQEYTIATSAEDSTSTTLTVTGDFREFYLAANDYVVVGDEKLAVTSASATAGTLTLLLSGNFTTLPAPTSTFNIIKPFLASDDYFVDYTFSRNTLFLVDGRTLLVFSYAGEYLTPHIITNDAGTRTVMGARTITYFGDRLYFGDVLEYDPSVSNLFLRQRIRWTEVLDLTTCKAASYQDLVRTQGKIVKILGMGSLMMVYMSDGLYYGRQTNLSGLPYAFFLLETAGITTVGMKAVSSYFDGQMFVGQDNVYYISPDASISPIGSNISDTLREDMVLPWMTYLRVDTDRTRVMLGVGSIENICNVFYMYYYRVQAWSRSPTIPLVAPSFSQFHDELYYYELDVDDTYETTPYRNNSFISLLTGPMNRQFLGYQAGGYLLSYLETEVDNTFVDGSGVEFSSPISAEIVTPDYDFDMPDDDKTALRLGLKITDTGSTPREYPIRYLVQASTDRGSTWKTVGTLRIPVGRDEDCLNFRVTGSTIRFKISTDGIGAIESIPPYEVNELTLRVRGRALETNPGDAR